MPRFYFHVHDDLNVQDEEGMELPDLAAARVGAIHFARSLMCDELMNGRIVLHHRIEIADEQQQVIDTIYFRDVVRIEAHPAQGSSAAASSP